MTTGLVEQREEFLLPDDAYPKLKHAYVWREKIKRKEGCLLLGRMQRNLVTQSLGNTIATGVQFNLFTQIIYIYINKVCAGVKINIPNLLCNIFPR